MDTRSVRNHRRTRSGIVAAITAVAMLSLGGCHVELTSTGLRFVCDINHYIEERGPLDIYFRPVNSVVGIFCPGYYPGGQG